MQGWLPQFACVVHIASSKALPTTTFRSYRMKGKMKDLYTPLSSLPLSPTTFITSRQSITYKAMYICRHAIRVPWSEVSRRRAGFSVPASVSSASIGPDV